MCCIYRCHNGILSCSSVLCNGITPWHGIAIKLIYHGLILKPFVFLHKNSQ